MQEKDTRDRIGSELKISTITAAFERPTTEVLREALLDDLLARWYKNHDILLKVLQSAEFPYCALHGSNQQGLMLIAEGKRAYLEVAVVPDEGTTLEKLFKFYHAVAYVNAYAFRLGESPGAILVHHFTTNKPSALELWENLYQGALGPTYSFTSDTHEVQAGFASMTQIENLGWRGAIMMGHPNFPEEIKRLDQIRYESLDPLYQQVSQGIYDQISRGVRGEDPARAVLARRFYIQELVRQIVEPK